MKGQEASRSIKKGYEASGCVRQRNAGLISVRKLQKASGRVKSIIEAWITVTKPQEVIRSLRQGQKLSEIIRKFRKPPKEA